MKDECFIMKHRIKDADYTIFKVRWYADERLLKNRKDNQVLPKQHRDRASAYVHWCWEIVEHLTGENVNWWHSYYPFNTVDVAWSFLHNNGLIRKFEGEGTTAFYVPKTNTDLAAFIKKSCPKILPIQVVTRYKLYDLRWMGMVRHYPREAALDFKAEMLKDPDFAKAFKPGDPLMGKI
jgi:hypothetical protein